jgi:hypothetical protein
MFNCVDCGYYSDIFSGDVSGISQGAFTYYARCPACGSEKVTIHGPENAITITLRKNNGYILCSRLPIQQTGLLSRIKLSLKKAAGRFDLRKPGHEVSRDISSVLTDEDKSEGLSIMDRDGQVVVLRWSKPIALFSKAHIRRDDESHGGTHKSLRRN